LAIPEVYHHFWHDSFIQRQAYSLFSSLTVDGFEPFPLERPPSVAQLRDMVCRAVANGEAVYPFGGGTMIDWGLPPKKPGTAVDLRGLDRVIDYPARDMTITVEAGVTIDRLRQVLRAEGQQLPVDVPLPERATIGGAVATNASGPRRFGYGTLRDYVIGIGVVNDRGEEIKGGGRVVKNVAGYDLMKLYTGSFGTLGVISQLTLKVKPLPEAVAAIVSPCPADVLEPVLKRLMTTATRPTVISVANGPASEMLGTESPQYTLLVAFEEKATTVGWQVTQLGRELHDELTRFSSEFQGDLATGLLHKWSDFPLATQRGLTFKANLLPAATAGFFRRADALSPRPALVAHAGNGIVFGHLPPEATVEEAKAVIENLGRAAAEAAGNVVIMRCPAPWKSVLPVWGAGRGDNVLMRAVKDKLDPHGIFNPGRFVSGI
jgi:glycolate oxidase FAD binding subunit